MLSAIKLVMRKKAEEEEKEEEAVVQEVDEEEKREKWYQLETIIKRRKNVCPFWLVRLHSTLCPIVPKANCFLLSSLSIQIIDNDQKKLCGYQHGQLFIGFVFFFAQP